MTAAGLGDHLACRPTARPRRPVLGGLAVGRGRPDRRSCSGSAGWRTRWCRWRCSATGNFSGTSFSIVLLSFTAGGLLLVLTQYLQFVLGYDAAAGRPGAAAVRGRRARCSTGSARRWARSCRDRTLIVAGLLVIAAGFGVLTQVDRRPAYGAADRRPAGDGGRRRSRRPGGVHAADAAVPAEHAGRGLRDERHRAAGRHAALSVAVLGSVLAAAYSAALPDSVPGRRARLDRGHARARPGRSSTWRGRAFTDAMELAMIAGADRRGSRCRGGVGRAARAARSGAGRRGAGPPAGTGRNGGRLTRYTSSGTHN